MLLFYAVLGLVFVAVTIVAPNLASSPGGKLLAILFAWVLLGALVGVALTH